MGWKAAGLPTETERLIRLMNKIFANLPVSIFEAMSRLRASRTRSTSARDFRTARSSRTCGRRRLTRY